MHIVHTEASLGWGGQEIRILTEASGMFARGHRVTLLCPPEARIYAEAAACGVPVVALPIGRKNPAGLLAMRGWLGANRADVVNTHSSTDTWLAAIACATLNAPPPLVRTRHISAAVPNNIATRWLYRHATRHIVTTGEKLREQLIRDNGIDPAKLISVPTGIDLATYSPGDRAASRAALGLPADATIIGIVATLRSWKGHFYLIDAFAGLCAATGAADLHLAIVGDGPQFKVIQQRVAERGLTGRVTTPGNQGLVTPWLNAIDIFCLPSYANEGVPQALMQAMACTLPVVSTPVGSIGEIVEHEVTGLLVEPRDADTLQSALARLIADPLLRNRLGETAHRVAVERFAKEIMLERMERVFQDATEGSHPAHAIR
jgi:glycosyltransferase involved in cell wall biosynthesis